MNIDTLTLGELKYIADIAGSLNNPQPSDRVGFNIGSRLIGKYCIARCYAAGVHAGVVEDVDGENVVMRDSRRLWSWKAKDGVALSGVAQNGLAKDGNKLDVINPVLYLTGVCELIPTTELAEESIRGYK